ncbi:hypothetical protein Ddye_001317 [Dipteronia dyeriana]|uniref:Uncharacterized protein n=1 Tax=Dipteronia dyeriana TaxID=168575 RepID=A0AAE0CTW2_9ROSI|nr:hypothetical protein Ddye_001317 [Dipteronia dyeriana]
MEHSDRCIAWTSCSIHHHHHHHHCHLHHHHHNHLIFCPLHNQHHHLNCHSRLSLNFGPLPPQYSKPVCAVPLQNEFNLKADRDGTQMLQEQEHQEAEEDEDDDDDEPIFVLTDEWREFFAASEVKRKLEKKKAKKKQAQVNG